MLYICIPTTADRRERVKETIDSILKTTHNIEYSIVVHENNYKGWPNAVLDMIEGIDDLVFLLESDAVVEEGCIETLYANFAHNFPGADGVVEPYNEFHADRLIQHPMCHARTLRQFIHRGYFHNFADNEMTDRMKATEKFLYVPHAKMRHKHFLNGEAEEDESYKKVLNTERWKKDHDLYEERKLKNYE